MPIDPRRILHEDDRFLAVLKLAGELVVAGKGKMDKLPLFDFLRKDYPGIHPVNRLDFETSGIVVFARGKPALKAVMDGKFVGWKKTYRTIVAGSPPRATGDISFRLPTRVTGEEVAAHTKYKIIERFEMCTLVEAQIESGKHHQIRRHFSMIKHPLVLDKVYGDKKFNNMFSQKYGYHRFFLHASKIEFPDPLTGKIVNVECELPNTFEFLLKKLREVKK